MPLTAASLRDRRDVDVENVDRVTGDGQVAGHRPSHAPESDEADVTRHVVLPFL